MPTRSQLQRHHRRVHGSLCARRETSNGCAGHGFQRRLPVRGSEYNNEVLRYDATTGAFVGVFVTAGAEASVALRHDLRPRRESVRFRRNSDNVVRYDGTTGQPLGTYITSGSGGLSWPEGMTFDPTGPISTSRVPAPTRF